MISRRSFLELGGQCIPILLGGLCLIYQKNDAEHIPVWVSQVIDKLISEVGQNTGNEDHHKQMIRQYFKPISGLEMNQSGPDFSLSFINVHHIRIHVKRLEGQISWTTSVSSHK